MNARGRQSSAWHGSGSRFRLRNLIAAQCGTAPEVLSRTFRHLEDDGVLAADIDHVTVLRPDRLRALAEWIED
jgi:hypothetical protein